MKTILIVVGVLLILTGGVWSPRGRDRRQPGLAGKAQESAGI
jgi:hypothetical protein